MRIRRNSHKPAAVNPDHAVPARGRGKTRGLLTRRLPYACSAAPKHVPVAQPCRGLPWSTVLTTKGNSRRNLKGQSSNKDMYAVEAALWSCTKETIAPTSKWLSHAGCQPLYFIESPSRFWSFHTPGDLVTTCTEVGSLKVTERTARKQRRTLERHKMFTLDGTWLHFP